MARLNTRQSDRPSTRFESATPALSDSDQENRDPGARARVRGKGKERDMEARTSRASLPTPTSDPSDTSRGQKRKRVEPLGTPVDLEEDEEEARFNRYFDPHQDTKERQEVARGLRDLENGFLEDKDDLYRNDKGSGLTNIVHKQNAYFKRVKQTGDATSDSRLLVNLSDLAYKKTAQLVLGDTHTGVDVDEFLSKCITFMRNGGPANSQDDDAPSSSRRRRPRHDEVDEDDEFGGEPLDWEFLGRHACFPYNARPPVPTFLLGPLSVEKKQRTQTQRRAKEAKDTTGREARPEALTKDDLHQADENGLTAICTRVNAHLRKHIRTGEQRLQRAGFTLEDKGSEAHTALLRKCRMSSDGGVSLFHYVINPRSFGQTVENIFYISFLIKEGHVGVSQDDDGLPTLQYATAKSLEEQRKAKTQKHQAVLGIDYATWEGLIKAFDIREPMIPHREDEQPTQVGQRGWYA